MKLTKITSISTVFMLIVFSTFLLSFSGETFLSANEAEKKWGHVEFDAKKFKIGDSKIRASMAASLISTKALVGTPLLEVNKKLGPSTGYYFSDMIPAYAIGDLSHGRSETWQIILIPDNDSNVIKEVKVHKKCCKK